MGGSCSMHGEERNVYGILVWAGIAQSVWRDSLRAGSRGSDSPGGGEIFRACPDRPWGPPSLLYNGYRVSFPGIKRPRRGVDHSPHLAPREKKEYSYTSTPPYGPSWPVLGWTLPLLLYGVWWKNTKESNSFEDLGLDGKIILKWTSPK